MGRTRTANLTGLGEKLPRGLRGPKGASGSGSTTTRGGGNFSTTLTLSGDVTGSQVSSDIATTIANGAVNTVKLADNAVSSPKLQDLAVETAKLANGAVTSGKIAADAVTAGKVLLGSQSGQILVAGTALPNNMSTNTQAPGTNNTTLATTAFVAAADALKANLASPTFTGVPAAPTAAPGTNTTQLSTTAFVQAAIAALIASAPGVLDTLDEIAAALGDDPNFATTITTLLAGKQPLDSDLTAIAALTTTAFGRTFLDLADAAAARTKIAAAGVGVANVFQGARQYFAANSEVFSIGLAYAAARASAGEVYYLGATNATTPDLLLSNAAGVERLRLTDAGNVGLGVTPDAWNALFKAFSLGTGTNIYGGTATLGLATNLYFDSGGWKYKSAGAGCVLLLDSAGTLAFYTAPAGLAGAAATLTSVTTITSAGIASSISHSGTVFDAAVITPTVLAANTDNWAPTSFATCNRIRAAASLAVNLTGIAGGAANREVKLMNIGTFNITLVHQLTSTAANQFLCPGAVNFALTPGSIVTLWYDGTSARWRVET